MENNQNSDIFAGAPAKGYLKGIVTEKLG